MRDGGHEGKARMAANCNGGHNGNHDRDREGDEKTEDKDGRVREGAVKMRAILLGDEMPNFA